MRIVKASKKLTRAAHGIIADGMAAHLSHSFADLCCDTSVTVTLARAGYGADSIRALRDRAVEIAGACAQSKKVH